MKHVVWITGASSGIGEALVQVYGNSDVKLIISARNVSRLNQVKSQLSTKVSCEIVPFDLGQSEDFDELVEGVWKIHGKVDLLINAGGISQRGKALMSNMSVNRELMEIDYFGTIALSIPVVKKMVGRGSGHVATITSLVGKFGSPYRSAYAAAKHALHGFFDSLRAELDGSGVHISLILPGFIRTKISLNSLSEDGSVLNQMDDAQANGMDPLKCAHIIKRKLDRKVPEFNIGGKEVAAIYLKRFFPGIFRVIIRKTKVR